MLVLTRKRGEVIRIGDGVVVKVIKTARGSVKIGIEAPADVRVVRGELGPLDPVEVADSDLPECERPAAMGVMRRAV